MECRPIFTKYLQDIKEYGQDLDIKRRVAYYKWKSLTPCVYREKATLTVFPGTPPCTPLSLDTISTMD